MLQLFITICIGMIGGYIGLKSHLPAGTILGSTCAVIAYKIFIAYEINLPKNFGFTSQVLVGILIAASYNADFLKKISGLWLPMITSCFILIISGVITAVIFYKMGYLDFPTAYISTSPGAMNVLVAISSEMHADVVIVAAFHFIRVFIVNLIAPFLFRYIVSS